jgi:NAD(P)-dependent dehydrogenase (short-subunit alcohol dehydrogenase family)
MAEVRPTKPPPTQKEQESILGALDGKRAMITGGASGIGRATAQLFAREGAAVVLFDLDESHGQTVVATITQEGGKAVFIHGDVAQADDCERAVALTVGHLGGIDVLFNNAGIIRRATVLETTEAEWDRVMAVNVKSIFMLAKTSIPVRAAAGGGVIINTASGWGLVGGRQAAAYCASKAAVVNLTRAMALDHGPDNIRVNCICPGDTDTPMLRAEAQQLGESDEGFLAEAANRPLGRIGSPEEIAQAVLFLASDVSTFVSGAALVVDGGGLAG